jgi:hypothetical protein
MKANEVRLGNLVNYCNSERVLDAELFLQLLKYTTPFEPIPLTEEWLLKFGFDFYQNIGSRKFMNFGNLIIETNAHKDIPVYYTEQRELICIIKYVHQLQNLYFALTSEDLTIKQQQQQ